MATTPNLKNPSERNGDNNESSSSGNELTAEWVVKAQLTISKPKKKAFSFNASDCGARRSKGSPCRVVYKWSSDGKDESQKNILVNTEKVREREDLCNFLIYFLSSTSSH